jgi:uncharacterized protein (DUF2141 family)
MKTSLVVLGLAAALAAGGSAHAATVRLNLEAVEPRGGQILVALQSRDQFLKAENTKWTSVSGATGGRVAVVLEDVPPGQYAVMVMHDADGDKTLKMSADGRPLEGWATRNAATLRAAPAFDQVSFTVDGDVTLTERMNYPANP